MGRFVLVMRPIPSGHGAFSFHHAAFWFWSWGVLPPYWEGQRPRCPIRRHTGNEDVAPPVRLNPARSSESKFQETIVPPRHLQSAKHKASHCTAACKARSSKHKGLKVSRDAKLPLKKGESLPYCVSRRSEPAAELRLAWNAAFRVELAVGYALFQHLVDIKIFHARKYSRAGTSCLYKH